MGSCQGRRANGPKVASWALVGGAVTAAVERECSKKPQEMGENSASLKVKVFLPTVFSVSLLCSVLGTLGGLRTQEEPRVWCSQGSLCLRGSVSSLSTSAIGAPAFLLCLSVCVPLSLFALPSPSLPPSFCLHLPPRSLVCIQTPIIPRDPVQLYQCHLQ